MDSINILFELLNIDNELIKEWVIIQGIIEYCT